MNLGSIYSIRIQWFIGAQSTTLLDYLLENEQLSTRLIIQLTYSLQTQLHSTTLVFYKVGTTMFICTLEHLITLSFSALFCYYNVSQSKWVYAETLTVINSILYAFLEFSRQFAKHSKWGYNFASSYHKH